MEGGPWLCVEKKRGLGGGGESTWRSRKTLGPTGRARTAKKNAAAIAGARQWGPPHPRVGVGRSGAPEAPETRPWLCVDTRHHSPCTCTLAGVGRCLVLADSTKDQKLLSS